MRSQGSRCFASRLIILRHSLIIHSSMSELDAFFKDVSSSVDAELDRVLAPSDFSPANLIDAMRWSIFAGGKRFRPALVFAGGRTFEAADELLISTAAAVEMMHTYSLIHDDLPSMDDDDLRRGRETCHKKFGESTAILAGDALQARAFQTIADDTTLGECKRIRLIAGLGMAAARMVGGQQLDLNTEGAEWAEGKELSIDRVKKIHTNKTGALIAFSVLAGGSIGDAAPKELDVVIRFGNELGLLFQITDDLLDISGSTESLGKTAGKDQASEKATYPNAIGVEESHRLARDVCESARASLQGLNRNTAILDSMVTFLLRRES